MQLIPSDYLKTIHYFYYNENVKNDIKIISISDLHESRIVPKKVTDNLKYQLEKEKANYHCLLGDLIDVPSDIENEEVTKKLFSFIKSSASMAPTIIILGSHDFIDIDFQNHYNKDFWNEIASFDNVYLLNDTFYQTQEILFMGYLQKYDYWYPYGNHVGQNNREDLEKMYQDLVRLKQLYTNLPEDIPKVGLMHSPDFYKDERIISLLKDYDIFLCGHYHNGCIPVFLDDIYTGNYGIITPKREIGKIARGEMQLSSGMHLIINGGITKIQYSASKLKWPLNKICYQHMDIITFSGEKNLPSEPIRKRVYINKR